MDQFIKEKFDVLNKRSFSCVLNNQEKELKALELRYWKIEDFIPIT